MALGQFVQSGVNLRYLHFGAQFRVLGGRIHCQGIREFDFIFDRSLPILFWEKVPLSANVHGIGGARLADSIVLRQKKPFLLPSARTWTFPKLSHPFAYLGGPPDSAAVPGRMPNGSNSGNVSGAPSPHDRLKKPRSNQFRALFLTLFDQQQWNANEENFAENSHSAAFFDFGVLFAC
ncbi:hypothetical protein MTP99_017746 [Tenebrio molitor]|nr:hypothetical protein MTP99_017746 [Tenebrio molitor]